MMINDMKKIKKNECVEKKGEKADKVFVVREYLSRETSGLL